MNSATRRFRWWGKKRGDRRSGSKLVGTLGEALFYGCLFLLGAISLSILITSQLMYPTPEIYQPGFGFWLSILVLASFVLIGGGGIVYTVAHVTASAERRSALLERASGMGGLANGQHGGSNYPHIPLDSRLADSPGVVLQYRLPAIASTAWRLLASTALGLLLTALSCLLVVVATQSLVLGRPDWVLIALALPATAATCGVVFWFLRQLWQYVHLGPTCVEISDLPLRPGAQYEIFLSQVGRVALRRFELYLVCEEEATYRQGTDVRTEKRVVYRQTVLQREAVHLDSTTPLSATATLALPADAMHTFQSGHNGIYWRLVVCGEPEGWPPLERVFPVIVRPHQDQRLKDQPIVENAR